MNQCINLEDFAHFGMHIDILVTNMIFETFEMLKLKL